MIVLEGSTFLKDVDLPAPLGPTRAIRVLGHLGCGCGDVVVSMLFRLGYLLPRKWFILHDVALREEEFDLRGVVCKAQTFEWARRAGVSELAARRRKLIICEGVVNETRKEFDSLF